MYCVLLTIISLFITKERAFTKAVHSMEKLQVFFSTEFTILFRVKIHQVWFSICSGFNAVQLALNSIIIFLNTLFLPFKTNVNRPVPILIRFEISVYLYRKYLTKGSTVQNFYICMPKLVLEPVRFNTERTWLIGRQIDRIDSDSPASVKPSLGFAPTGSRNHRSGKCFFIISVNSI